MLFSTIDPRAAGMQIGQCPGCNREDGAPCLLMEPGQSVRGRHTVPWESISLAVCQSIPQALSIQLGIALGDTYSAAVEKGNVLVRRTSRPLL